MPLPTMAVPQYLNKKGKVGLGMVTRDSQGSRSSDMSTVTRQIQVQAGKLILWARLRISRVHDHAQTYRQYSLGKNPSVTLPNKGRPGPCLYWQPKPWEERKEKVVELVGALRTPMNL